MNKHPNHVTIYYVQPYISFHVQWVKTYAELNLTWNWHIVRPSQLDTVHKWVKVFVVYMVCQLRNQQWQNWRQDNMLISCQIYFSISFDPLDIDWYTWLHIVWGRNDKGVGLKEANNWLAVANKGVGLKEANNWLAVANRIGTLLNTTLTKATMHLYVQSVSIVNLLFLFLLT